MQLASSNLPVGGYSWSQGLEWAVEAGWVPDAAAFERWQLQQMEQSFFTVDLPLFARLYQACENDDLPSAQRWTAWPVCWPTGSRIARRRGAFCVGKVSSPVWPGSACVGKSRFPTWR